MAEYFIEFHVVGGFVKVTAIDPESGTEASIVGDPHAARQQLEQLAVKRLIWVMKKRQGAVE